MSKNSSTFSKTTSSLWAKAASYVNHEKVQNGKRSSVTPIGKRGKK